MPTFLSRKQVAQMLSVTVRTVDRWVNEGFLPRPVPVSRKTKRFRGDEILAHLEQQKTAAGVA